MKSDKWERNNAETDRKIHERKREWRWDENKLNKLWQIVRKCLGWVVCMCVLMRLISCLKDWILEVVLENTAYWGNMMWMLLHNVDGKLKRLVRNNCKKGGISQEIAKGIVQWTSLEILRNTSFLSTSHLKYYFLHLHWHNLQSKSHRNFQVHSTPYSQTCSSSNPRFECHIH